MFLVSALKKLCMVGWHNIIQLLPLCEGNMTVCSPEAGNIARGQSPRAILPVEGEQIVMLPSHKGNSCFIMPINICVCNVKKKKRTFINAVSLFKFAV